MWQLDPANQDAILSGASPHRRAHFVTIVTAILTVVHLLVAFGLVFLILLHSGKGGMGDLFGGGGMQSGSLGGSTLAERNLDRFTVIVAIIFALTTMGLAILLGT